MKLLKKTNNIILLILLISIICIIYYWFNSNTIIEGAQTNEEKTKSLNAVIIEFTQDLYDKVKYLITTTTAESEDKTDIILKEIDDGIKEIEESNQVDPKELERWEKLKKVINEKKMHFTAQSKLDYNSGVSFEIDPDVDKNKIRGIINKYV